MHDDSTRQLTWHQRWTNALRHAKLPPDSFAILTHLGYHADYLTGAKCHPSLTRLEDEAQVPMTTLKRRLRELETQGWITRDSGRKGKVTQYTLIIPTQSTQTSQRVRGRATVTLPTQFMVDLVDPKSRATMDPVHHGPSPWWTDTQSTMDCDPVHSEPLSYSLPSPVPFSGEGEKKDPSRDHDPSREASEPGDVVGDVREGGGEHDPTSEDRAGGEGGHDPSAGHDPVSDLFSLLSKGREGVQLPMSMVTPVWEDALDAAAGDASVAWRALAHHIERVGLHITKSGCATIAARNVRRWVRDTLEWVAIERDAKPNPNHGRDPEEIAKEIEAHLAKREAERARVQAERDRVADLEWARMHPRHPDAPKILTKYGVQT